MKVTSPFMFAILLTCLASQAQSADLTVSVAGIEDSKAEVGCTLFSKADGFPMDAASGKQLWLPVNPAGPTLCQFTGLTQGSYAVSVGIDQNKNRKVDTNFLGIPTEQWGVSNNVRPNLRAPRFDEAAFKFDGTQDLTITIRVAK
jgi:uncharacterized protein (DUF2141 family)